MKTTLTTLVFCLFVSVVSAQTTTGSDSVKIHSYITQSHSLINTNRSEAKAFAGKALQLANKTGKPALQATALMAAADAERFTDDINKLLADEANAIACADKSTDNLLLFDCLNAYALDLIALTRFDKATAVIEREKNLPASIYSDADRKARLLNTQGYFIVRQQKSMTEGKGLLNQSLGLANEAGDSYLAARNKLLLFRAMLLTGARDSTFNAVFEAINTFQKNGYPEEEAYCNIEISNSYRFVADLNKSSEYAQTAYNLMVQHGNHLGAGTALALLFQNYYFQSKQAEAKKVVDLMNAHYTKLNFENGIGTTDMFYGAWHSANGDYAKADDYFAKANEIADRLQLSPLKAAISFFETSHLQAQHKQKEADSAALKGYALTQKALPKELLNKMYSSQGNAKLPESQALDKRLFTDSAFRKKHGEEALQSIRTENGGIDIYKPVLSVFDSGLNSVYSKQLTEIETRYKTREKDDQLRIGKQKAIADMATIQKQNLLIILVAVMALFLASGLYLQYRNRRRAERDKAKIEMLQNEIHHRVKNNLGVINRLIEVAGKGGADNVSLQTLQTRVKAIELLHKRLYNDNLTGNISLQEYLLELTAAIQNMFEDERRAVTISVKAPVEVSSKTAEKLGLIVNELVTNSYKYAFDERQSGSIFIEAQPGDAHEFILTVADNGKGFTAGKKKSYGMKLIAGLSHELSGSYAYANGEGTQFNLTFKDN